MINEEVIKRCVEFQKKVDKAEMEKRKKNWKQPKPNITEGYMARYAKLVTGAASGAVFRTDET